MVSESGKPTLISYGGANAYQNLGAGFLTVSTSQNITENERLGSTWLNYGIGFSFGSKSFFGGSAGVQISGEPK